jgi:hypothetical protein
VGIISDIVEANKERIGQRLPGLPLNCIETPSRMLAKLACPICADLVRDESELQRHMLRRHGHLQVYLKLNGCVVPEVAFIDQPVKELTLVLLGEPMGAVKLTLNAHELFVPISQGKPIAFKKHIPADYVGRIGIYVTIGKVRRDFVVYCRTQPELRVQDLDEAIWNLQGALLNGTEPHWTRFQQEYFNDRALNSLEKRYLEGLYSYLLGCFLEGQGSPHAGQRLEDALGPLAPFSTSMAHTARCVLGIKLNAFRLLKDCGPNSRFYASNIFFNGERVAPRRRPHLEQKAASDHGLWVDDFLEQLLNAIFHFADGQFDHVERMLLELRNSPYFKEPNNRIKVALLQARTAHALNKPEIAKRAYTHLLHHPLFGKEAERYCE